jgi:phosphoadenosine phosphosulfate reductase
MPLIENNLFGTIDKVQQAIERLHTFCPPEGYWVAISGGKDSCVIYDLCKKSGCMCEYHHNLTTIDPPEVIHFLREHMADVSIDRPEKPLAVKLVEKGFPPLRTQRWCCEIYKERGGAGRLIVTGVRSEESPRRKSRRMVESCFRGGKRSFIHPIIDWTSEQVWLYIKENALPYLSLYDCGFTRVGCVLCPMTSNENRAREMKRFPRIAELWHRAIVRAFENRGDKPVLKNFNSGEELWRWWVNGAPAKGDQDQTTLFE